MRLLYHHRIASKDGQFVHIEEIVNALTEQGHDINIVSPSMTQDADFGHDGGFVSKLKSKLPKFIYEIIELGYGAIIAFKLIKEIVKNKPDIIYERYNLYQPVGVFISKLTGIPIILEVNAPLKQERERFYGNLGMPRVAKAIEDWTWKNSDAILPVTDVLADHLRKAGVNEHRIHVIHNGIRDTTLNDIDIGKLMKSDSEKTTITVGFVGFMHLTCGVEKAIDVISDIHAKFPDKKIELICVGDGNVLQSLKDKAKFRGIEKLVSFTGMVARDLIFKHIEKFDITLQPDVTDYASPLKVFEYMAVASIIVAPSSKNILEILDKDSAILFNKNDEGAFEIALTDAILNYDTHKGKGNNARDYIDRHGFTWQANGKRIVSIAQTLLSKK